jgi:hypothetical protein
MPFVLCLKTVQPFQFLVNTFGVVTQLVSINRFGTASSNAVPVPGAGPIVSADGRFVVFERQSTWRRTTPMVFMTCSCGIYREDDDFGEPQPVWNGVCQ